MVFSLLLLPSSCDEPFLDEDLRDARIVLSTAIQKIIKNGLDILKIDCPESM